LERVIEIGPEYEDWLAAHPTDQPPRTASEDDTCLLLYTSGTTGFPKGVMLTHANVNAHTRAAGDQHPFEPDDRNLVAMPLFHVGGTCYAMVGMDAGIPTTLTRDPDAASLAGALAAGATHAFLVPAVVGGIMAAGDKAIALFKRLRYLSYGASPMPLPLLRAALAAWPDTSFLQVYGMTELSGMVTALDEAAHRDTGHPEWLASAGKPILDVRVRVVDPATGTDAAVGERGELWFQTPQRMAGYWGKPEATAETITPEGWLRSGDIGRVDADGFVYIEDRLKDMIISGGENIYSSEVEQVVAEYPAVAEVAVIGIPDDKWGEAVLALVTVVPGQTVDEAELIAFCRDRLAHFKCPSKVTVIGELPRTPTGKILKRSLRQPYWAGRDRAI
jgi:acyl-CoA synthetase (AMP-forming)/AMP-acid ligase II